MAAAVLSLTTGPSLGVGGIYATCKVVGHFTDRPLVVLDAGRNQGLSLGDPAVLLVGGNLSGTGRVFYLEPDRCGVRLNEHEPQAQRPDGAVVVSRSLPGVCRVALPPDTTVWAAVEQIAPGHRTAWLNRGRNAGLRLEDGLLVLRDPTPIARAEVVEVSDENALVRLQPITSDLRVRPGDPARLWPSPAEHREGVLHAPVLLVEQEGSAQSVWLAGGTADGLTTDRQVELLRGGTYVATAVIDRAGEAVARAATIDAYVHRKAQVGDSALLLDPRGDHPQAGGRVFRIEGNYCLVSIGEDSGVRRDQLLYVVRDRQVVGVLKIKTVKQGYCGAEVQVSAPTGGGTPELWDQVLTRRPQRRLIQEVGRITRATGDGEFAVGDAIRGIKQVEEGTIVSITSNDVAVAAGVIVHNNPSHIILHVPRCWREGQIDTGSKIIYIQDLADSGE